MSANQQNTEATEHLILKDDQLYVGNHILADFYGAQNLGDPALVESAMTKAALEAGATILELKFHRFGAGGGVTGVVLLSESHMSIHSWPEYEFAAVDIFMCGNADPQRAVPVLLEAFRVSRHSITQLRRGENLFEHSSHFRTYF